MTKLEEFVNKQPLQDTPYDRKGDALFWLRALVREVRERAVCLYGKCQWLDGSPYNMDECLIRAFNEVAQEFELELSSKGIK